MFMGSGPGPEGLSRNDDGVFRILLELRPSKLGSAGRDEAYANAVQQCRQARQLGR
jgi:hypothetical protein